MTLKDNILKKFRTNKMFFLVFLPATVFFFAVGFMLLAYPQAAGDGVKEGIAVCLDTVIPSLFPFLLVTSVSYDVGIFDFLSRKADKITSFLFALPGAAFPIILMSLLGGFPVGAILSEKAFEKGQLSGVQAKRLLMFCVNPGPAFAVSAVGYSILGSKEAGLIIYLSIAVSSVLTGVLVRFFDSDDRLVLPEKRETRKADLPHILSDSVTNCVRNMLNICVWVVIFSCLGKLAEILPLSEGALVFFKMTSEVTNGVITASKYFMLPVITAVISFAGFCVHFQLMPYLVKLKLKYKYFLSVRILSAALSCCLSFLFLKLFPQYCDVVSLGTKPVSAKFEGSFPVCVWLMLMCGLFIIGDNYVLKRKSKKIKVKATQ